MDPALLAFWFTFLSGIVGQISLCDRFRFLPANRTIDHRSRLLRLYYRLMAVFMCQLWSFLLTAALLGALDFDAHLRWVQNRTDSERAIYLLVYPLPLMPVFYFLYAWCARWMARRERPH